MAEPRRGSCVKTRRGAREERSFVQEVFSSRSLYAVWVHGRERPTGVNEHRCTLRNTRGTGAVSPPY